MCGGFSDQFFLGSCVIGDETFLLEVGLLCGMGFDAAGTGSDVVGTDSDVADTGFDVADTGFVVADTGSDVAGTGFDVADTGSDVADTVFDVAGTGFDVAGGWPEGPGPECGASGGLPCSSELLCVDCSVFWDSLSSELLFLESLLLLFLESLLEVGLFLSRLRCLMSCVALSGKAGDKLSTLKPNPSEVPGAGLASLLGSGGPTKGFFELLIPLVQSIFHFEESSHSDSELLLLSVKLEEKLVPEV